MTVDICLVTSKDFLYAGLQGSTCYCTAAPPEGSSSLSLPETRCNVPCPGNPLEICGGPGGMSLKRQIGNAVQLSVYRNNNGGAIQGLNTSTIYGTQMVTVLSCAPTGTYCPFKNTATATPNEYVVYATQVVTIKSCSPQVQNCPYRTSTTVTPVATFGACGCTEDRIPTHPAINIPSIIPAGPAKADSSHGGAGGAGSGSGGQGPARPSGTGYGAGRNGTLTAGAPTGEAWAWSSTSVVIGAAVFSVLFWM